MLALQTNAPEFSLEDQNKETRTLKSQEGKWTLIYFYPKDDTPGCTTEACMIRDVYNDFERMGVNVFGVSMDSPESHKKFAEKYELPFTLLSDKTGEVIRAYEAWGGKKLFGRAFEGILRVSYLINPQLQIVRAYPNVDPAGHALEILSDVRTLM